MPEVNIWGYGRHSKGIEGSRLYSKIMLGLQATKQWGSRLHGKHFRPPGLRSPALWDPEEHLGYKGTGSRTLCLHQKMLDMFNCHVSGDVPA